MGSTAPRSVPAWRPSFNLHSPCRTPSALLQVQPGVQHPTPSACMVAQLQTMGMHSDGDTASSVAGSPTHPHVSNAISLAAEDVPDSARAPGLESGTSSCGESS